MMIVIVSDANSFWIKEYIDKVFKKKEHAIVLITYENKIFKDFYQQKGIDVIEYNMIGKRTITDILKLDNFSKRVLKIIKRCDVIHIQSPEPMLLLRCALIWKLSKKRIITFWGSDLLRAFKKDLFIYYPFLKSANTITLMTKEMTRHFNLIYNRAFKADIKTQDFGVPMYSSISECSLNMSRQDCKCYWGIDENKIVIPIGYNGNIEQQHITLIRNLLLLPESKLQDIAIIVHFGYGGKNKEYHNQVQDILKRSKINYLLIDRFLNQQETAILRLCADAFLYGQTTDALAGSVLEYVYAGCTLIKPNWLDYSVLDELGIPYVEYNQFEEIPDIIAALEMYEHKDVDEIRRKLWNYNSWDVLVPQWKKLYECVEGK